jgi:hypothetical protein
VMPPVAGAGAAIHFHVLRPGAVGDRAGENEFGSGRTTEVAGDVFHERQYPKLMSDA